MKHAWILLLCVLSPWLALEGAQAQAGPQLGIEWRDAATVRVDWATPGQVTCIFVEDTPTGLCGEYGSKLIPFIVYPDLLVHAQAGAQVVISRKIPPNAYPVPLAAQWVAGRLEATITGAAPARGLRLVGGGLLSQEIPESYGQASYTFPDSFVDQFGNPSNRWLQLIDTGQLIYQVKVPPHYVASLPLVAKP